MTTLEENEGTNHQGNRFIIFCEEIVEKFDRHVTEKYGDSPCDYIYCFLKVIILIALIGILVFSVIFFLVRLFTG